MGIKVKGLDTLYVELEKRFGQRKLQAIIDKALIAGAKVIEKKLKENFETFKDTGESIREITIDKPKTLNGVRTIMIHWQGPENRWKIIHLNEYGSVKNPNPRGKGAIDRSLRAGSDAYYKTIEREISRLL